SQHPLISGQRLKLSKSGAVQLLRVPRCKIAQSTVLQPTENGLQRVEHRCVRWQFLQTQTGLETCQLVADRVSSMHLPSIPHHHHTIGDFPHQVLKEASNLLVIEVSINHGFKKQPDTISLRRQPESCRHGNLLPVFSLLLELG